MTDVLQTRQLIPPITARTAEGKIVRAWDYKHRRNLVIAFLHTECAPCAEWLAQIAKQAAILAEHQATTLIVWSQIPPLLTTSLPSHFVTATDAAGKSQLAFLGKGAFGPRGLDRIGVFVTDRYGELYAQWIGLQEHDLPAAEEILAVLWQIQNTC